MIYKYRGSVPSDLSSVAVFLSKVTSQLNQVIEDGSLLFDVRLIIHELVINGCDHGNRFDREKKVGLDLSVDSDRIVVQVQDEGTGIGDLDLDNDPKDLRCNGRGLLIVSKLSDEMTVEGNCIRAVIKNR
jgi:serine/threonine-protein kinase RsbW